MLPGAPNPVPEPVAADRIPAHLRTYDQMGFDVEGSAAPGLFLGGFNRSEVDSPAQ